MNNLFRLATLLIISLLFVWISLVIMVSNSVLKSNELNVFMHYIPEHHFIVMQYALHLGAYGTIFVALGASIICLYLPCDFN